jgi:glycosyltransferase involved in cell wall biosynthesis
LIDFNPEIYLSIKKLSTMYSAADVYINSSFDDAGPTMVNQALMCGTPVIAFDTGVAQELVINDQTGYRVKLKDANDLANGIIQMIEKNENEKKIIRDNCRNLAMEKFSLSVWAKSIEMIFNKVVN